jgi:hypothetical protein
MRITTTATVQYVCYLKDEDAEIVRQYAENEGCSLREAVSDLYADGVIDLYYESSESDFSTESIDSAEE